jgi:hypothetical protein
MPGQGGGELVRNTGMIGSFQGKFAGIYLDVKVSRIRESNRERRPRKKKVSIRLKTEQSNQSLTLYNRHLQAICGVFIDAASVLLEGVVVSKMETFISDMLLNCFFKASNCPVPVGTWTIIMREK